LKALATNITPEIKKERTPRSAAERIFYKYLARANRGSLEIQFPSSGEFRTLGQRSDSAPIMQILDERFFWKVLRFGEVGFGEAYVDGLWTTDDLAGVLSWFLANNSVTPTFSANRGKSWFVNVLGIVNRARHALRRNTRARSKKNISEHYDLSNEFFSLLLDKSMTYSCAMFTKELSLHQAQLRKFEVICQKLGLKEGMRVLEIGCGWGGFAVHAATHFGVHMDCITISREQHDWVKKLISERGLEDRITVRMLDYRDLTGQYDRVVSIEMVEALGYEFLDQFFQKAASALAPDGLMLIQAITFPDPYYEPYLQQTDWTQKYIFPGSCLLSLRETLNAIHRTSDLVLWDVESLGPNYAETLRQWRKNLHTNRSAIEKLGYDERFFRKWNYYLVFCEVGFEARYINVQQWLFGRPMAQSLRSI